MNIEVLIGKNIHLEPLQKQHEAELYQAAQHENIWTYHVSNGIGQQFYRWFNKALKKAEEGQYIPYAVRRLEDGMLVGSTRYYDIVPEYKRLAIGNTWYIPEVWGTHVNTESKYLLLKHAFEVLAMNRVEFSIDLLNKRSQAALKKLGAKEEGLLRKHIILESGRIRDSVLFSILDTEWNEIKQNLEQRLEI